MTKLQRAVDAVLAFFLLALIFTFGFKTIYPNFRELYDSARLMSKLSAYLPKDYGPLDLLSARKTSFETTFTACFWKSDELGYLNSSFQYALGKNMINAGSTNMVRIAGNYLYDMQNYVDTSAQTDEIIRFARTVNVPFTYLYEHPTTYDGVQLTGGYAMLDKGDEMSDEIVAKLRDAGIKTLDSRDILAGYPASQIVMHTDQHWTTYAALLIAKDLAGDLGLNASLLDPAKFDTKVYPQKCLGKTGQRVGPDNITPDDITVYWPKYGTDIIRQTQQNKTLTEKEGAFKDSVIKWECLEGEGWSGISYKAYGLTENFEHFHNAAAPDVSILIYKDSYAAPIGAFLSLVARDVYTVDMRKSNQSALYYIRQYQPDQVIMAYSRQMLCDNEYDLFTD